MIRIILSVFVLILLAVWNTPPAQACANIMFRSAEEVALYKELQQNRQNRLRPKVHMLAAAEREPPVVRNARIALAQGRYDAVITGLFEHYGLDLNGWALNPTLYDWKQHRVVLLVSLAMLRSEGKFERYHERRLSEPRRQVDNVRWAVHAMKGLAKAGYAPELNIAEAWGRDPELAHAAYHKLRERNLNTPQQALFERLRSRFEERGFIAMLTEQLRALLT